MNATPHLAFQDLRKAFFGVEVLKGITFSVSQDETLGLVGENGAGKSTLMNILGGNLMPDSGTMRLAGRPYAPRGPLDAEAAGIAFIHQELNLFTNLSVAENLFLTHLPTRGGLLARRALERQAAHLLEQAGLHLAPSTLVKHLSPGERQLVEIAKAIGSGARMIIFDEPTTSLSSREIRHLFDLMKRLQSQGVTMLYISHILTDVLAHCHRIAVLRDGQLISIRPAGDHSADTLIRDMVGRDLESAFPPRSSPPKNEPPMFTVEDVSQPGVVHGITLSLKRSEIVGLAGLMGSGRTELARILFGLDPFASGRVTLDGAGITHASPKERVRLGLAFLTEDRRHEGLMMQASIAENIDAVQLPRWSTGPAAFIDQETRRREIREVGQTVHLDASVSLEQAVKTLSGGNQQKAVLAKWLLTQPKVFILDEPTRGIDVGAKFEIYRLIQRLAREGTAFLIISSEIEELLGLCHRILVMRQGEISDSLDESEFDQERILRACLSESSVA